MDPRAPSAARNPYEVLGVSPEASLDEIRDAYWRLVRFYRTQADPSSPWTAAHLEEVQSAYELLSDPARRAEVDAGNHGSPGDMAAPVRPVQPPSGIASDASPPLLYPGETAPAPVAVPTETRPQRPSRNPIDRLTYRLPRPWRIAIDWIVTIAGAVAIVLAIKAWVVNPYRIPSSSMEPTLHCAGAPGCEAHLSDRVLANRFIYHFRSPHRGEIVVFKTPPEARSRCGAGGTFVKRLIALPGETWSEKNGFVYIDGRRLNEPYIKPDRRDSETHGARKIPKGMYFMMGDNRQSSCDSRVWGPVPRSNLIGEVFATYWPPNRISIYSVYLTVGFLGLGLIRLPLRVLHAHRRHSHR
jgi:signal peptidase I